MKARTHHLKLKTAMLLTVFSGTLSIVNAQQSAPFKLYADVTHNETVPQASNMLKPFVDDDQSANPLAPQTPRYRQPAPAPPPPVQQPAPPRYTVEWFMIPRWMAGTWLKDGDLTTQVVDLRTGRASSQNQWTENRLQASWGHQIDTAGNVWHVNILPSERDGMTNGKAVRFLTVAQRCLKSSPQELVTSTHYIVSESNPWNNQPFDTFQQESLNHYYQNGTDLQNSSSNRMFTYQGAPVREGHLESRFKRIAQFSPVATMNGVDLKVSLRDFLESQRSRSVQ